MRLAAVVTVHAAIVYAAVTVHTHAGVIVPAASFVQKGQVRLEHLEPKYKNRFMNGTF